MPGGQGAGGLLCACCGCLCDGSAGACLGWCDGGCDGTNQKDAIVTVSGIVPPAVVPCPPFTNDCCLSVFCRGRPAYDFNGTFLMSKNCTGNPCNWCYDLPFDPARGLGFTWGMRIGTSGPGPQFLRVTLGICGDHNTAVAIASWTAFVNCPSATAIFPQSLAWRKPTPPPGGLTFNLAVSPPPCPPGCSNPLICPGGFLTSWTVPPTLLVTCP